MVSNKYAWRNPSTEQICFLRHPSMPHYKCAIVISQLADTALNLLSLKFFGDNCISDRLTVDNFVNQALRQYTDKGILYAAETGS